MSRLDRKSVSFALFSAFLARLETTQSATAPAGYPRQELRTLLCEAALSVAVDRVNEEWTRVAGKRGYVPDRMRLNSEGLPVVVRDGRVRGTSTVEYEDLIKYYQRVTRGLPEIQGFVQ